MFDFSGKTILITGATGGFGGALAVALAEAGAHLVLLGRQRPKLEEIDDRVQAAGGTATLVPADLSLPGTIEELSGALVQRYGMLDGLVGAAAVLKELEPVCTSDPKTWRRSMAINLIANQRLIACFDPLLRAAPSGRAVFITCSYGAENQPFWAPYATSKRALEHMAQTYAAETANSGVRVNLFDPGPMDTAIRRAAYPGEAPGTAPSPDAAAKALLPLLMPEQISTGQIVPYEPSA